MCANAPSQTRRQWGDFVVASHLFFVPALAVGLVRALWDMLALTSVMLVLSVWYHRTHEKNAAVARVELCATTSLFLYGLAQAYVCTSTALQLFELASAFTVLATYAACFHIVHTPEQYDLWHPLGLHVVPALWALAVAQWHEPVF